MNDVDKLIHIPAGSHVLWVITVVIIILSVVMTYIFKHHWNYYGVSVQNRFFITGLYLIGSILIIILLITLAIFY